MEATFVTEYNTTSMIRSNIHENFKVINNSLKYNNKTNTITFHINIINTNTKCCIYHFIIKISKNKTKGILHVIHKNKIHEILDVDNNFNFDSFQFQSCKVANKEGLKICLLHAIRNLTQRNCLNEKIIDLVKI